MIPRTISPAGIALIKRFEGFRSEAYQDAGGVWTIGYGHTNCVKRYQLITEGDAEIALYGDLETAVTCVDRKVGPNLTQNQFDALVSLVYNVGVYAFTGSTLLRLLNEGDPALAAQEFVKWDHVGIIEAPGLLARRKAERDLFLSEPSETS